MVVERAEVRADRDRARLGLELLGRVAHPVLGDDERFALGFVRRGGGGGAESGPRVRADLARFPDADDVILWNERGEITETTIANLVLEIDDEALTPKESSGLLPGTLRAELLANRRVRETVLTLADLDRADAIWAINSLRGWIPTQLERSDNRLADTIGRLGHHHVTDAVEHHDSRR